MKVCELIDRLEKLGDKYLYDDIKIVVMDTDNCKDYAADVFGLSINDTVEIVGGLDK